MSDESKIPLPGSLQEIVGALLLASETPLTAGELREAVKAVEPQNGDDAEIMDVYRTATGREMEAALKGLGKALEVSGTGLRLTCAAGAYRIETAPSCGRYVRAMLKMDRPNRLGRATLETLAIVAYRQPITKSEIEEIRGVDVSGNVKTLVDLGLVRLVGKSELPGHPFLYGTTPLFLEHFGLASLQQLNELDPTLQRSDPRAKAASYRKKVEHPEMPLEEELNAMEEKEEEQEPKQAEQDAEDEVAPESQAPDVEAEDVNDEIFIAQDDLAQDEEDEEDEDEEDEFDEEDEDEDDEFDEDDEDEDEFDEEDEDDDEE